VAGPALGTGTPWGAFPEQVRPLGCISRTCPRPPWGAYPEQVHPPRAAFPDHALEEASARAMVVRGSRSRPGPEPGARNQSQRAACRSQSQPGPEPDPKHRMHKAEPGPRPARARATVGAQTHCPKKAVAVPLSAGKCCSKPAMEPLVLETSAPSQWAGETQWARRNCV
jgi:hypothetical protein